MYLLWFWWHASKQINGDKGEGGKGGRGKKQFMCQLWASMFILSKRCQAGVLFIEANSHSSHAERGWVIMAVGIDSAVDPRHACMGAIHTPAQHWYWSMFCIPNADFSPTTPLSHHNQFSLSLSLFSPLPACLNFLCSAPFLSAPQTCRQTITSLSKLNVTTERGWIKWKNVKQVIYFFSLYAFFLFRLYICYYFHLSRNTN